VTEKPPENLRDILLLILKTQSDCQTLLYGAISDIDALQLTLAALIPGAGDLLHKAFAANRKKVAASLQQQQTALELLRATVSTMVQ
jgi:hypothetical protein